MIIRAILVKKRALRISLNIIKRAILMKKRALRMGKEAYVKEKGLCIVT